jgi:pre-mRNA-processing factor 40
MDLEKTDIEEKKKQRRRTERVNREKFRDLLKSKIAENELTHKTKWKNFVQTIKDKSEFTSMVGQNGSAPHELFEDC